MSARISELEEAVEQGRSRAGKLEKERNRLQIEIHDVVTELEEVHIRAGNGSLELTHDPLTHLICDP